MCFELTLNFQTTIALLSVECLLGVLFTDCPCPWQFILWDLFGGTWPSPCFAAHCTSVCHRRYSSIFIVETIEDHTWLTFMYSLDRTITEYMRWMAIFPRCPITLTILQSRNKPRTLCVVRIVLPNNYCSYTAYSNCIYTTFIPLQEPEHANSLVQIVRKKPWIHCVNACSDLCRNFSLRTRAVSKLHSSIWKNWRLSTSVISSRTCT